MYNPGRLRGGGGGLHERRSPELPPLGDLENRRDHYSLKYRVSKNKMCQFRKTHHQDVSNLLRTT